MLHLHRITAVYVAPNLSVVNTPGNPTTGSSDVMHGTPTFHAAAAQPLDVESATFAVKRALMQPWQGRKPQPNKKPHIHVDTVPWDLDELMMGAKELAKHMGVLMQRVILGGGIYWSVDGCIHAAKTLYDYPKRHSTDCEIHAALTVLPHNWVNRPATPTAGRALEANRVAAAQLAAAQVTNTEISGALACASFLGCLGMGLFLLCDDVMLGSMVPGVVPYANSFMSLAVPMMCAYAMGVAIPATHDLWRDGVRVAHLKNARASTATSEQRNDCRDTQQLLASHIAQKTLQSRQLISGLAVLASAAMGVGIALIWFYGIVGLFVMVPGVLSLPVINHRRHVPQLQPTDLPQLLSHGNLSNLSNTLVYLDKQQKVLDEIICAKQAIKGGDAQKMQADGNGSTSAANHSFLKLAQKLLVLRTLATREHIARVNSALRCPTAAAACSNDYIAHLAVSPAKMGTESDTARQMMDHLRAVGLFETLALAVAQEKSWEQFIPGEINKTVTITEDNILELISRTDFTPEKRLQHLEILAKMYVDISCAQGRSVLAQQKDTVVDLWLERVV